MAPTLGLRTTPTVFKSPLWILGQTLQATNVIISDKPRNATNVINKCHNATNIINDKRHNATNVIMPQMS